MPRPVYIICCQNAIESKENALMTLVEVIEKAQITPVFPPPSGQIVVVQQPLRIVSTWMLLAEDDEEAEYEFAVRLLVPDGTDVDLGSGPAVFTRQKPFFRITAVVIGVPFSKAGLAFVEGRLRKKGDENWLSQDYPIIVEQLTSADNSPA